jgi:hypothetical protein
VSMKVFKFAITLQVLAQLYVLSFLSCRYLKSRFFMVDSISAIQSLILVYSYRLGLDSQDQTLHLVLNLALLRDGRNICITLEVCNWERI